MSGSIKIQDEASYFKNSRQYEHFFSNHVRCFALNDFFFEDKSIYDNLRIILKMKRSKAKEAIHSLLADIGLQGKEKTKVRDVSSEDKLPMVFSCLKKESRDILLCRDIFKDRSEEEKKAILSFLKEFSKSHLVIVTGCEENDIPFLNQSIDIDDLVDSKSEKVVGTDIPKVKSHEKMMTVPPDILLKEGFTGALKSKTGLIRPLILSAVIVPLLGVSFSMFRVSRSDGIAKSLAGSNDDTIRIQKSMQYVMPVRSNPRPSYEYQSLFDIGMNSDDISYLEKETGLKMYGVMSGDSGFQRPLYSRYDDYSDVLSDVRKDCLPYQEDTAYDVHISYGKAPEKEDEILISDMVAESLVSGGFYDAKDKRMILPREEISSSLLGRHIEFHHIPMKIVGIYESGIRFEDYASLKNTSYEYQHNQTLTETFRKEVSSRSYICYLSKEFYDKYENYHGYYSLNGDFGETSELVSDNGFESKIDDFGALDSAYDIYSVREEGVLLSNSLAASYFKKVCQTEHVDFPSISIALNREDSVHSDFVRNTYCYDLKDISYDAFLDDIASICFYRAVMNHFDDVLHLDSELSSLKYASHPLSEYKVRYLEGNSEEKESSKDIICHVLSKHIMDSYLNEDYRFYPEYVKEATNLMNDYGSRYQPMLRQKQKEAYAELFSRFPDETVYIDGNRYSIGGVCFDNAKNAVYLKSDEVSRYVKNIYSGAICRNPKNVSRLKGLSELHCRFKNCDESSILNPIGTYYQIQGRDIGAYNSVLRVSLWLRYLVLFLSVILLCIYCSFFFDVAKKNAKAYRDDCRRMRFHGYGRKNMECILLFQSFLLSVVCGIIGYGMYGMVLWILNVILGNVLFASVSFFIPSLWILLLIPVLWILLFFRMRHWLSDGRGLMDK